MQPGGHKIVYPEHRKFQNALFWKRSNESINFAWTLMSCMSKICEKNIFVHERLDFLKVRFSRFGDFVRLLAAFAARLATSSLAFATSSLK